MDTHLLLACAVVFLFAGLVKGVSGMGLPTFSIALLSLVMPPATAVGLMVLPSLATNVTQCLGPHWRPLARRLWPMWAGLVLVTAFMPMPLTGAGGADASAPWPRLVLGGVLLAYGGWGLARPALPDLGRHGAWASGPVGLLSGLLTAATGVFVMPLVPYLQSLRLDREAFIQALGLSFTLGTVALALRLGHAEGGELPLGWLGCLVATATAFAGLGAGTVLRRHLAPAAFQRALYTLFVALGGVVIARALS